MIDLLNDMKECEVVLDTDASFSYVGRLNAWDDHYIELDSLVVYDERIVKISLEEFLIECRRNGLTNSRGKTLINRNRVLAISSFDAIIMP